MKRQTTPPKPALKRVHWWIEVESLERLASLAVARREDVSTLARMAIRDLLDRLAPVGKPRRCPGCGWVETVRK